MSTLYKYPHTPYLPWSPTIDSGDLVMDTSFIKHHEVVVTEKMDGENITMYRDYIHGRSLDDDGHVSKDWVKNYWSQRRYYIPENYRICGECLYIKHSIPYDDLPDYFMGFSVWDGDYCLDWDSTLTVFKDCGIMSVPFIMRGQFNASFIELHGNTLDYTKHEGYVVRTTQGITPSWWNLLIGKYVRPHHVQTTAKHWKYTTLLRNKLHERKA
jgi:hypothetical protein